MKNYLFSILLLLSFGTPFIGTCYFLKHQKKIVKKEIKKKITAGIDKSELICLKFSKAETRAKLRWEHAKEFEFEGEMHDVVESDTIGDTIYYWCWQDHEESKLNKLLKKLVEDNLGNNPLNKERQDQLDNFYKSLFAVKLFQWKHVPRSKVQYNTNYVSNYSPVFIIPPTPPPKKG